LVIGDATSLTEAGYVGDDVESLLSRLIQATEGDIEATQRGIVYIDEIDKIRSGGSGFKDLRLGVQHALLKMLESTIATVPPQGGYKHPAQPGIPFDTTNVLFICGGAFVGPEEIIAKRLGKNGFGFGQMSENRQVAADGLLRQVKPEDLEQFGLIPEIIGRLPVIAPLDALSVDDLARILQSTKGSLIQQYRKLVRFHGADLVFTDAAVREIARIAFGAWHRSPRAPIGGRGGFGGGDVRGRGGREVHRDGQDGQGRGAGQAEHVAIEGTAELASAAKTGSQESLVKRGLAG
jgi:ATP-dependent Clp protease ATP-binding subunit ClpX